MDEQQGVATVGCYYCRLLHTQSEAPCPLCGGRHRFIAARMMDEESVRQRVREDVRAFQTETDSGCRRKLLIALLETLFLYGSVAVDEAAAAGADLDTLRRCFEDGGPGQE